MTKKYTIYALTEPDTGQVRYIGRTQDLPRRISEHLNVSKGCSKVMDWVFALKEGGTLPSWKILEETNNSTREKYWQELYEKQGCELLNQKIGGKRDFICTAEMKSAMSAPHIGTKMSEEKKRLMAEGRKNSPFWRQSVSRKGFRWSK